MTPLIYNGKKRAAEIKKDVALKIAAFKKESGITPVLVIVKANRLESTEVYTRLKEKAAEEVGAKVEIYDFGHPKKNYLDFVKIVRSLDLDPEVHGIMIQLPFPDRMKDKTEYVMDFIPPAKDVDGLNSTSSFSMPVVMAVEDAVRQFQNHINKEKLNSLVVGAKGFVGKNIVNMLKEKGHEVREVDRSGNRKFTWKSILQNSDNLDLIITATGQEKLLHEKNVVEGVGIIDIGAPCAEVDFDRVKDRISFITPVPGGVGPVTIAYLLENLYKCAYNSCK